MTGVPCSCWCGRRVVLIPAADVGVTTVSCGKPDCADGLPIVAPEPTYGGKRIPSVTPRAVQGCGTDAGYQRHRRLGEDACAACKVARARAKARRKGRAA